MPESQTRQCRLGTKAQERETVVSKANDQTIRPKTARAQPRQRASSAPQTVRPQVRGLLTRSPGYRALPAARRQQIAEKTVQVACYLADPGGLIAREFREPLLARVTSERPMHQSAITRLRPADLRGDANQFDALVSAVSFPAFVAGLIDAVFGAIVNASIEQMRAYERLIASVAKTVDRFSRDSIDDTRARDALAREFDGVLCWTPGPRRRLVICAGAKRTSLATIGATIGLKEPMADLTSSHVELRLVAATRRRIARSRQQLLATALLMGINRIVVTDGSINAR